MARDYPKKNDLQSFWRLDDRFFCIFYEDGSVEKINVENFVSVFFRPKAGFLRPKREFYILYMTKDPAKGFFYYLPIAAFRTEEDRQKFHDFLVAKGLLKA